MEEEKTPRDAEELQRALDAIRREAEEQGLAIVVSWYGEYGTPESIQMTGGDKIQIGVKQ